MKSLRIIIPVLVLSLMAIFSVFGQRVLPPPPKPADSGPTLAVTMKFIQEKLNGMGRVSWTWRSQDSESGAISETVKDEHGISQVTTDEEACKLSWQDEWLRNGEQKWRVGDQISLKDVETVTVMQEDEADNRRNASIGTPEQKSIVDSPVPYELSLHVGSNSVKTIYFMDEDTANRVAKAMIRAVELCGGGYKEPF